MHGEENRKKDLLNDEFNFSYKLYKTHFEKIQKQKPTYNKFNVRIKQLRMTKDTTTNPKTSNNPLFSRATCSP